VSILPYYYFIFFGYSNLKIRSTPCGLSLTRTHLLYPLLRIDPVLSVKPLSGFFFSQQPQPFIHYFRSTTELSSPELEYRLQDTRTWDSDIGPGCTGRTGGCAQPEVRRHACIVYHVHIRLSPLFIPSSTSASLPSDFRRNPSQCPGSALPWVVTWSLVGRGWKSFLLRIRETIVGNEQ